MTSLADGADQVVAARLMGLGAGLEVVVPSRGYESAFGTGQARAAYRTLLAQARRVIRLPFPVPSEEAFLAAGLVVVDHCDELVAVWDGLPARGAGGTADVVAYAGAVERPVRVLWPAGAAR